MYFEQAIKQQQGDNHGRTIQELQYGGGFQESRAEEGAVQSSGERGMLPPFHTSAKTPFLIPIRQCEQLLESFNNSPTTFNPFLLVTFADLKRYIYHYWFAFPALVQKPVWHVKEEGEHGGMTVWEGDVSTDTISYETRYTGDPGLRCA